MGRVIFATREAGRGLGKKYLLLFFLPSSFRRPSPPLSCLPRPYRRSFRTSLPVPPFLPRSWTTLFLASLSLSFLTCFFMSLMIFRRFFSLRSSGVSLRACQDDAVGKEGEEGEEGGD